MVKLGIMSDNHGRLPPLLEALRIFDQVRVESIVHCGDLGGLETLEELAGREVWFVWGNTDRPEASWRPVVAACGAPWPDQIPVVIERGPVRIAVMHGHEPLFNEVCACGRYDYVLHGHSHQATDRRQGQTRIINPGALHRAARKTVATLNTDDDSLNFYDAGGGVG